MYDRLSMRRKPNRFRRLLVQLAVIAVPLLCLCGIFFYAWAATSETMAYRLSTWRARILYALNPPEESVFVPEGLPGTAPVIDADLLATLAPSATPTLPTDTPTAGPTETPAPTPTITPTPTPVPGQALLEGVPHAYQMFNNCGPANLAMALGYWGWEGDQRDTAAVLKPNPRDKNVMPYEMVDFVNEHTDLSALSRTGGDLATLKAFISAGYPIIVEKGFEGAGFDGWMGHYEVLYGYDDASGAFTVQDSYKGPGLKVSYDELLSQWRAFNFTYIVVYPLPQELQVYALLGPMADLQASYEHTAALALEETQRLSGRDRYFAWYNRGSSLVALHDYQNAATAFDAAFANYAGLSEAERPWRMLWYQTGPYFAYYYSQRFNDVINLATETIDNAAEPVLEESFYWRGRAKAALGDLDGAVADYRASLEAHPDFPPSVQALAELGYSSEP